MKNGAPGLLLAIGIAAGVGLGAMLHNPVAGILAALALGVAYGAWQYFLHPRATAPKADAPAKED